MVAATAVEVYGEPVPANEAVGSYSSAHGPPAMVGLF